MSAKSIKKRKIFKVLVSLLLISSLVAGYLFFWRLFIPRKVERPQEKIEIKINPGLSVIAIADLLAKKGVIENRKDFILITKLFRNMNRLKAGKYDIQPGLSVYRVMKIIVNGKTSSIKVVLPEGLTSYQIASILMNKVEIDSAKFISLTNTPSLASELKIEAKRLEGYLFPNTYYFHWGITEKDIIKILVNEFHRNFTDSLKNVVKEKGWTVHQIVTLASIIEGEAVIDSERAIISAVYHNRLKKRMLLQADPTIQYIIPDGPRRLLNKDLQIDSPYNTYRYIGLPPGPVNNPGIKSILAAIYPADIDYLYFVAKGDGSHIFSKTLSEHLVAKRKFDEYRRMIRRKQRQNESKK